MTKILHVINGLNRGGGESFIMNLYRNIDKTKFHFDFLLRNEANNVYEREVRKLGSEIFYTAAFPKNMLKNVKQVKEFFKNHNDYDVVHIHANSLFYIVPVIYAKKYGIKKIIMHSHNTSGVNRIVNCIHYFFRPYVNRSVTKRLACTEEAGRFMFGKKSYIVIKNSIDVEKYMYSEVVREEIQQKFNIKNKFVIGHVGRFVEQKNHDFLIDIFYKISQRRQEAVLLLVGTGPLHERIIKKVRMLNLEEKVIFLGDREDVEKILSACDLFLFPSLFEGLGIVLVEAQASGLRCVYSDVIPADVKLTSYVENVSLSQGAEIWADVVLTKRKNINRVKQNEIVKLSSYGIEKLIGSMEKIYTE